MKITITLNMIKVHSPCKDGWEKLLKSLSKTKPDDDPLTFSQIAKSNGVDDTFWCLRALAEDKQYIARLIAADIAERVLPIFEKERPNDDRPRKAIEAARKFAHGEIDDKARAAARTAAGEAAGEAAWDAAWEAARAAGAAAWAAAGTAAGDAAWAAAGTAAGDAAWAAAGTAAGDAAWDENLKTLLRWLDDDQPKSGE